MPIPLTALFATAIHQVRSEVADPSELGDSLDLLMQAARGQAVQYEVIGDQLRVNATPVPASAPGAQLLVESLLQHHTARLELPAGLGRREWHDIAELYASAPGLYQSIDELRDAIRASVPEAVVAGPMSAGAIDLREAVFELPGLSTSRPSGERPAVTVDEAAAAHAAVMVQLDPVLARAQRARGEENYPEFAGTLLEIRELEGRSGPEHRALISHERRRLTPPEVLDQLARLMTAPNAPPVIEEAVFAMGRDGTEALLRALSGTSRTQERRIYMDALVRVRDGSDAILKALTGARISLVRDATEVAGRRRMVEAVPALTQLMRHREQEVRTAVWYALEQIGTPEAVEALRHGRQHGRN
jgi:HEAT repeats